MRPASISLPQTVIAAVHTKERKRSKTSSVLPNSFLVTEAGQKVLKGHYPVEGNGARRRRIQIAEEGHFTQIMGLRDSGMARFMYGQGSFDAATLESP